MGEPQVRTRTRYCPLGGLSCVVRRFEAGEVNLDTIAEPAGCSRETVRQDIIRHVGTARYEEILCHRLRHRHPPRTVSLDLADALKVLAHPTDSLGGKADPLLPSVLSAAQKAGVVLRVMLAREKDAKLFLPNGKPLCVRTVRVNDNVREHRLGLHRFKTGPHLASFAAVIFCIQKHSKRVIYVFRGKEVSTIRSLILRFDSFQRKSKYNYALDRWDILRGPL